MSSSNLDATEYLALLAKQQRPSKYKAKPVVIDGIHFASTGEGRRYRQLCLRLRAGEIRDLELQPRYPLVVNGVNVGTYVADFRYVETATGETVTEDFKGGKATITPVFRLKAKLVRALYGIVVQEVTG
jgi:hypothetical protein